MCSTLFLNSSSAIVIDCKFNSDTSYAIIGNAYQCVVQDNLSTIPREDLVIESAKGTHVASKTNDDVKSLQVYDKGVHFVPRGLERVFKNLRSIYIHLSNIQEVRQADLKPLPELIYFQIRDSELRFIEDGTFDFNPKLECVWFINNKIFHFDTNVFKNLNKISWLGLASNLCMNVNVQGNLADAKSLIDSIKVKCFDIEFFEFKQSVENLEIEGQNLNSENFKNWTEKVESLEKFFKNSRFSYLNVFKEKFRNMKEKMSNSEFYLQNCQLQFCTSAEEKLSKLTEQLENCNKMGSKISNIDKNIAALTEMFSDFKDQIEDLKVVPVEINNKFHKFELEQKELKSKIDLLERKFDTKIAKVIEALKDES